VETIFVLLPLALLIAAIAVGFFIWAARSGQFDDLDTPAVRMLFDDPPSPRPRASQAAERGFGETRPRNLSVGNLGTGTLGAAESRRPEAESREPEAGSASPTRRVSG
jgi:cbb3-type cytochrome oxidase maturation protein